MTLLFVTNVFDLVRFKETLDMKLIICFNAVNIRVVRLEMEKKDIQ